MQTVHKQLETHVGSDSIINTRLQTEYIESEWDDDSRIRLYKSINDDEENEKEGVQFVYRIKADDRAARLRALRNTVVIFVLSVLMSVMIFRYASISSFHKDNLKIENDIEEMQTTILKLETEVSRNGNVKNIIEKAEEIGMEYSGETSALYLSSN